MMRDTPEKQRSQPSVRRNRFRFFALTLALGLLSGCASGGRITPAPQPDPDPAVAEAGPKAADLAEEHEGFIIRETADLDAAARRRFDEAVALLQVGAFERAAALLEPVVEASPTVSAPYINLALACVELERTAEAEEFLRAALAIVPGHPVAANAYGRLLRRQGRFAEARAVYEQSLSSYPEYLPARRNLGILCELYLDDAACALEQYETYFAAKPQQEEVGIWIAALRLQLGLPADG